MENITNEERERICNQYELASKWMVQLFPMSWYARYSRWVFDRKFQRYLGYLEKEKMKKEPMNRMYEALKSGILRS